MIWSQHRILLIINLVMPFVFANEETEGRNVKEPTWILQLFPRKAGCISPRYLSSNPIPINSVQSWYAIVNFSSLCKITYFPLSLIQLILKYLSTWVNLKSIMIVGDPTPIRIIQSVFTCENWRADHNGIIQGLHLYKRISTDNFVNYCFKMLIVLCVMIDLKMTLTMIILNAFIFSIYSFSCCTITSSLKINVDFIRIWFWQNFLGFCIL